MSMLKMRKILFDMKSRPDKKLDIVEAMFYVTIIIMLVAVGLISSVR